MFSKKFFVTLAVLSLIAILTYGMIGSGAWFTDGDTGGENIATMGTLNFDIVDGRTEVNSIIFNVSNVEPGVAFGPDTMAVVNNGSIVGKFKLYPQFVSGNGVIYNNLWVKVEQQISNTEFVTVYEGWLKDMMLIVNNVPGNPTAGFFNFYQFTYTPSSELGNDVQGQGTEFHYVLYATQNANTGW